MPTAVMMPVVAALEISGWSFERFRQGTASVLASSASKEANLAVAREQRVRAPMSSHLVRAWALRLLSRFANAFFPFDIERFIAFHFSKTGDQTRALLRGFADLASAKDVAAPALNRLLEQLGPAKDAT